MNPPNIAAAVFLWLTVVAIAVAADPPALATAHGTIEKIEKDVLTLKTRGADGKFSKPLVLKLTGTSRITTLVTQTRDGKVVLTQKETEVKALEAKQTVAVIYAEDKNDPVLLSAVVEKQTAK